MGPRQGRETAGKDHTSVGLSYNKEGVKCPLFFFFFLARAISWKLFARDEEGGKSRPKDPDGSSEGERSRQAGEAGVVCGLREEVGPTNAANTSSAREGKRKGQVKV